jgi:hypothetical protein
LHIENNTGREITASFYLGDYSTKTYQESYGGAGQLGYQVGSDWLGLRIPSGDSDIRIKIAISQFVLPTFCRNDTLAEPLHLLYSLGDTRFDGFLLVDKSINKRLQELACNTVP